MVYVVEEFIGHLVSLKKSWYETCLKVDVIIF